MTDSWPKRWGFLAGLDECVGKTIERADIIRMPYGCTWDSAWVVSFTDGSRAFFNGGRGTGIVGPTPSEMEKSIIFNPSEVAQVVEAELRERRYRERQAMEDKERRFEQLKKELGR